MPDTTYNPFAPITPAQLADVHTLTDRAHMGRNRGDRIRRQARSLTVEEGDRLLAKLRGEPEPPKPQLCLEPRPADEAAIRAATKQRLTAAYEPRFLATKAA